MVFNETYLKISKTFSFYFIYSKFLGIPPYVNPLALAVTMVLFLLNPTKTFVHEARFWFLRKLVLI